MFFQLDVKIILSWGKNLDVIPRGAGKGEALEYLLKKLKAEGIFPANTLACGDSEHDAELFSIPDVHGVMVIIVHSSHFITISPFLPTPEWFCLCAFVKVSNSQEELLKWHSENGLNNSKVIHSSERCADGIIQAIGHFKLGPNLSPRDVIEFLNRKTDNVNPAHEIVRFYLFYERLRRGEIKNYETYIASLKESCVSIYRCKWDPYLCIYRTNSFSVFFFLEHFQHQAAVFFHPSGAEKSLRDTIDEMRKYHGDKKGKRFWVCVDQVLVIDTTPGKWIVEFDKWEQCGKHKDIFAI